MLAKKMMQSMNEAVPTQVHRVASTRLRPQTMVSPGSCSTVILFHDDPMECVRWHGSLRS